MSISTILTNPIAAMLGLLASTMAGAELAIVVHMGSANTSIEQKQVASIFLGKKTSLPDGTKVVPQDQVPGNQTRIEFYQKVVNKTPTQINSYWSRLIFTGKGRPPYAVGDDQEVLDLVASNPNMMGYVNLASLTQSAYSDQVKVILTIQ